MQLNGGVTVDSGWNYGDQTNATQNFWRSVENLAIVPGGGTTEWAVSQAAPMRRVHIIGNLHMGPTNQGAGQGYSSGGFIADSRVDSIVSTGSQQQWYTRDSNVGVWYDGVWNTVFSGVGGAPGQSFPAPPYTTVATTPVSREKPYLYIDSSGKYRVFVPSLRTNSSGATWNNGVATPGTSIPMSQFYVARPGDTGATLNAALAAGAEPVLHAGRLRDRADDQRHARRHRGAGHRLPDAAARRRRDADDGGRRRRRQDRRPAVRRGHRSTARRC